MSTPFPISPLISGSKEHLKEKVWFTLDAAAPEIPFGFYGIRKPSSGVVQRTRTPDTTHTSIQFASEDSSSYGGRVAVAIGYTDQEFNRLPAELLGAVLGLLRSEWDQPVGSTEVPDLILPVGTPMLEELANSTESHSDVSATMGDPNSADRDRVVFWNGQGQAIGGLLSRVEGLGDEYFVVTDARFPMLAVALRDEGLLEPADLGFGWKGKTIYRASGRLLELTGVGFDEGDESLVY